MFKKFLILFYFLFSLQACASDEILSHIYDFGTTPHYDIATGLLYLPELIVVNSKLNIPYIATVARIEPKSIKVEFSHEVQCNFSPYYSICNAIKQ